MAPMDDAEMAAEMRKMTAFIKQEALEKAREIKVKADEEFAIEKGKIVRQEKINIEASYEKKAKQGEIQKKIAASNQTNKARLQLLQTREELLEEVFESARSKTSGAAGKGKKYNELLQALVLQGLYSLMEKDIQVIGRKKDKDALQKAVDSASATFKEKSGYELKVEVKDGLPDDGNGGVKLVGYNNRITVDNTLDERMKLLEEQMLPQIRTALFGPNPSRKFFN